MAAAVAMDGMGIPAVQMAGLGLFFLYLTWRGWPVMGSMRFRARLSGRDLHYRRNAAAPVEVVPLDRLKVTLSEAMQLISVHVAEPRRRLFMVDNSSSFGARLAWRIVELQEAGKDLPARE